jgi:NAD(P)H dehydrogenase (quinone)
MIYVTIGSKHNSLKNINEVHGGSAWGAGTISGADGSRQPSQLEIEIAQFQGYFFLNNNFML